jgi:hypothetical protein
MTQLSQIEADRLLKVAKRAENTSAYCYPPSPGERLETVLTATTGHERFFLTAWKSLNIQGKLTYQTREGNHIVLARLDCGAEHRNPNGERIGSPHLHLYREGYGDTWAIELPNSKYADFDNATSDLDWLDSFLKFCNIDRGILGFEELALK